MNPLSYEWTGDSFKVLPRFAKEADKRFVVHERYVLDEIQERSSKTHAHYFASVGQAWVNLREDIAHHWPTADHLRKWALIKAGFHNHRSIVAKSKAEALRLAAFIRPMDEFAIVTVNQCVVDVFTAQSQSMKSMGKKEFAKSKEAVLAILATMIDVTPAKLERAGAA
jgi:hypothetical protein